MSVSRQLGVASKVAGHGPSNLESKEWPSARGADPYSLRRRGSDAQHPLGVWVRRRRGRVGRMHMAGRGAFVQWRVGPTRLAGKLI